jgi:hypothetical protein
VTRGVAAVDRVLALLLGLTLVALGAGAFAWQRDLLPGATEETRLGPARDLAEQSWWPWALGGGALVLVLLALWWLAAHLRRGRVRAIRLAGSDGSGVLRLQVGPVVEAAGRQLGRRLGVTSVRTSVTRERGAPVAELVVTTEHGADLSRVTADVRHTCRELATALDGEPLTVRVLLHAARAPRDDV